MCLASLMIINDQNQLASKAAVDFAVHPWEATYWWLAGSARWPVYPISVQAGLDWKGEGSMESFEGSATHFWAVQKS